MKGIPPEIDRLLWSVAEQESSQAGDEFVRRYPKYAGELARRRNLVKGLKGTKPSGKVNAKVRPEFRPKAAPRSGPIPRPVLILIGATVLTVVALGAYTAAKPPERPITIVRKDPVAENPPVQNVAPRTDPVPPVAQQPVVPPPDETTPGQTDISNELPSSDRPRTFRVTNADLESSLTMLGVEAGVRIQVAPGMAPRRISADYAGVSLSAILSDLARKYGFTVFDQGDGSIIVVPAVDSSLPRQVRDGGGPRENTAQDLNDLP